MKAKTATIISMSVFAMSLLFACGKSKEPCLSVVDAEQDRMIVLSGDKIKPANFYDADFVVLGGGLGGIAAALSICSSGRTVILVEESSHIAGCFDPQGTTQFRDNRFIDSSGSSKSYQEFRNRIREWYEKKTEKPPEIFSQLFNGITDFGGDNFCFETEAALKVLNDMIAKNIERGKLTVVKRHKVAKVVTFNNRVASLHAIDMDNLVVSQFAGWMFVDASRTGHMLPLAGIDFIRGREDASDTGETIAPAIADSLKPSKYLFCTIPEDGAGSDVIICDVEESLDAPVADSERTRKIPVYDRSRRIRSLYRITTRDIAKEHYTGHRGAFFRDSVGIGYYPISTVGKDGEALTIETVPFQIPLRSILPVSFTNVIAGGRTIGASFIAATAYMAPSVEWTIGEAAGEVAAYCAGYTINTHQLVNNPVHVRGLQEWIVSKRGVPIYWYDDVTPNDPDFAEAQLRPFDESGFHEAQTSLHYREQ